MMRKTGETREIKETRQIRRIKQSIPAAVAAAVIALAGVCWGLAPQNSHAAEAAAYIAAADSDFGSMLTAAAGAETPASGNGSRDVARDAAKAGISDGTYEPGGFAWSGGSGRLKYIKCDKITVKGGAATARLEFGSDKYDRVRTGGKVYEREGSGNSVFTVPVNINANTKITGRTTAMSQPHWVDYDVYVYMDRGDGTYGRTTAAEDRLDEKAPEVFGLSGGQREDSGDAAYLRIFGYDGGFRLVEVDVSTKSVLGYGEPGESVYERNVVSYLFVPEGSDAPAGTDRSLVVVQRPASDTFRIEDVKDVPYQDIVRESPDAAVLPGGEIRKFLWFGAGRRQAAEELEKRMETLGVPLIFDRQDREKGGKAKAQWEKMYELFK